MLVLIIEYKHFCMDQNESESKGSLGRPAVRSVSSSVGMMKPDDEVQYYKEDVHCRHSQYHKDDPQYRRVDAGPFAKAAEYSHDIGVC